MRSHLPSRLLAAGSLALSLVACSPGSDTPAGKTLNIAFFGDNTTLVSVDPFQVYWLEHRVLLRNVAESLTDQDHRPARSSRGWPHAGKSAKTRSPSPSTCATM